MVDEYRKSIVAVGMCAAGLILLGLNLFGCFAILGLAVPPSTWTDALLEISLLGGFPIYLLTFLSLRLGTVALWLYFLANWSAWCLCSVPPQFFWPLDIYSALVLAPVIIVQLCYLAWPNKAERTPRAFHILSWVVTTREPA
jgi:hypothetical protein